MVCRGGEGGGGEMWREGIGRICCWGGGGEEGGWIYGWVGEGGGGLK